MRRALNLLPLLAIALAGCQSTSVRTQPPAPAAPAAPASAPGTAPLPPATSTQSPWQDARARGVGFRAVGNEPGWFVEVDKGSAPSMRLVLDYGERRLQVAHSLPFSDPQTGTAGFRGKAGDGTPVELTIQRGQCQDDMSGERFDASAKLDVGNRHYTGCGRFLFQ